MTDRELLEKAAKAIGMPKAPKGCEIPDNVPILFVLDGKKWNPLTDDGDALRLAVKLNLHVTIFSWYCDVYSPEYDICGREHNEDNYAATRRAIVRAAAAIGETL